MTAYLLSLRLIFYLFFFLFLYRLFTPSLSSFFIYTRRYTCYMHHNTPDYTSHVYMLLLHNFLLVCVRTSLTSTLTGYYILYTSIRYRIHISIWYWHISVQFVHCVYQPPDLITYAHIRHADLLETKKSLTLPPPPSATTTTI